MLKTTSINHSNQKKDMKAISILIVTLFTSIMCLAQNENNIIFRSENGERFWVHIGQYEINSTAENNMRITQIFDRSVVIRIIFENINYQDITKTITFDKENIEKFFTIKRTRQGRMVAKLFSESTIGCVHYKKTFHPYPLSPSQTNESENQNQSNQQNNSNSNINNNNINININIGNENTNTNQPDTPQPDHYILEGYSGEMGCPWPMSPRNFSDVKSSITSKTFDSSKIQLAKQIIDGNCFLAYQVKELVQLMDFENSRLEIAKYAYSRTFNQGQYFKVNDAFSFESSIDDLVKYIGRQ